MRSDQEELDEAFLARFEEKWFRSAIGRLLRIEEGLVELADFPIDAMPDWVGRLMGKLLKPLGADYPRPELMGEEQFGKLLGSKVLISQGIVGFFRRYDATDDATRAQMTKSLGGSVCVKLLRAQVPQAQRIEKLRKSLRAKVERLSLPSQGRFFRGYADGLLFAETVKNWASKPDPRMHSVGYVCAYAFLNWQRIEELRGSGGWQALFQEFTTSLPEGAEISEDSLRKMLVSVGIGPFGKRGAPRKKSGKRLLASS